MFKISLEDARKLSGQTREGIADYCGISKDEYQIIEGDPSQASLRLMLKISYFLRLSLGLIFPGNKADCQKYNHSQSITQKPCSQIAHAIK